MTEVPFRFLTCLRTKPHLTTSDLLVACTFVLLLRRNSMRCFLLSMPVVCCTKVDLSVLVVYLTSSVSVTACGKSEMASIFNISTFINLKKPWEPIMISASSNPLNVFPAVGNSYFPGLNQFLDSTQSLQ